MHAPEVPIEDGMPFRDVIALLAQAAKSSRATSLQTGRNRRSMPYALLRQLANSGVSEAKDELDKLPGDEPKSVF
jgi:hypothetical protein